MRITPWLVCLSAALFFAYELTQLHMLNAISPMLMKDLHLSATDFGSLSSTYLLADVIFLLPAGMIIDRFSPRKAILGALLICILGTFAFAMAQSFAVAAISHFLSGIGNAFCFLSCMILVSRWFPPGRQAFVMGVMITIGLLGGVIAQSPFSLLATNLGWRGALLVDASIGIAIFAIVFLFVSEPAAQTKTQSAPFWKELSACLNRQNVLCGLYTGFMNLPVMIVGAVWGSLFLSQVHNISLSSASFITGMICTGTIIGSPLCGLISDRKGNRSQLMFLGALLSLAVMLLIMYLPAPSAPILTALFFLLGFFTSTQVLGYPTITESNPPHLSGTAMGIAAVIIMGLAGIFQSISGYLIDLNWGGTLVNGIRLYTADNFRLAFAIFPIGFVISIGALAAIRTAKQPT